MVRYFDADLVAVPTAAEAYYTQIMQPGPGTRPAVTQLYFPDGTLYSETTYANAQRRVLQGPARTYYPGGQPRLQYTNDDGQINGYFRSYYPEGQLKRNDLYDHGRLVKGQYFAPDGTLVEPHVPLRQNPAFPGGDAALVAHLNQHLEYPREAQREAAEGQVIVGFIVTARGDVVDVYVQHSVSPALDAAAVAAVRTLPAFTPGRIDGERQPIPMLVPITFKASGTLKTLRRFGL
ncbi:hypothetical protein B0919_09450 [Hymenobacter sp. CRA2]|nr:hypothetical protein B0919_09450 [Hymenobacter sp. CRA2]